jgi:hypothetical protein
MASEQHNFIVSAIARKIKQAGFSIIYLEGKYQDVEISRFDIPPKITRHRPDVVGEKDNKTFCVGEAKTRNDLHSDRTRNQITDFWTLVKLNPNNKLIIGIPLSAELDLQRLFLKLGLSDQEQIDVICIPDKLLPNEEDI